MNLLAAGILWLAGQGFLLVPSRMAPLAGSSSSRLALLLGGICILAALTVLAGVFLAVASRQRRLLSSAGLCVLGLLGFLFFQARLYPEALLVSAVCIAGLAHSILPPPTRAAGQKHLSIVIAVLNAALAILIITNAVQLPQQSLVPLTTYRYLLSGLFMLSSLASGLGLARTEAAPLRLLEAGLAVPWMAWLLPFLVNPGLAHILPAASLVFLLVIGSGIPWNQFVLPEGDRIGRRLALAGSVALLLTVALIAFNLSVLERSAGILGIEAFVLKIREWTFVVYALISALLFYGMSTIAMTVHSLMAPEADAAGVSITFPGPSLWSQRIARYLQPFSLTREGLRNRVEAQTEQINVLSRQLANERRRTEQLAILNELRQQLDTNLDPPVAAQLVVNTLERALQSSFVCLYLLDHEKQEFVALASSGRTAHRAAPGYRQKTNGGVLGRVYRLRKTQTLRDTRRDEDYLPPPGEHKNAALSYMAVPLLQTAIIRGAIEIESEQLDFFTSSDVVLVEQMAAELVGAWARSSYRSRLMELIQAGISLSTMVEPDATVQEIASIAERTLEARFTYVSLLFDREENLVEKAHRGHAPRLLRALEADIGHDSLLKASLNAAQPFRIRDVRKYFSGAAMELDHNGLRSLLAVPIRLHGLNIGAILAFGKQQEACFSESDESLASLLASQAAAAIESVWLQQELRTTLGTTRLLYELSHHIIQAGELSEAAQHIAAAAHRLVQANRTGIVLFKPDGSVATRIEVDSEGPHTGGSHPMQTIEEVLHTGRMVYQSIEHNLSRICLPIQTPARKHGALWLDVPEERGYKSGSPADLQTLTNQAALALERLILMVESRQQALEIEDAFHELELAYDRTLAGLISTLDARDRETEGHSTRVSLLTVRLGSALGLQGQQLKALERGALLHDIGKIGISDEILHKPGPLTEMEWRQMRMHPRIGARIIEGIPFLEDSLPVILSHHERWDGSGYPQGRKGQEIPWLARIFSVVDAFDALTSDRPYRSRIAMEDALSYIRGQAGSLFDPQIVEQFVQLVTESSIDAIMPGKPR